MKIGFFEIIPGEDAFFKASLPEDELIFSAEPLDQSNIPNFTGVEIISTHTNSKINSTVIENLKSLKLICTRTTGFDHIDTKTAAGKNIPVCNVPAYGENTVAEFAFALLLALSRKVPEAHKQVTETGSFLQAELKGFDLKGKTIGVIGTGRIGMNAIKMAKGFQMNVVAYDPFPKTELADELGFRYVGFEELLGLSDIITLHAMLADSTRHMINEQSIYHIKRGAILINTARGGLVQTSALVKALEEGVISAAGLDVLEEEGDMQDEMNLLHNPHPKLEELQNVLSNNYLINHPRVIVTPHIAFNTAEAVERILDTTIENILSFANGQIKNRVPS
jgi:D-lactate dehydrogenase